MGSSDPSQFLLETKSSVGLPNRAFYFLIRVADGDVNASGREDSQAGAKHVVVDAKVPLDAFLDACAVDPGDRESDAERDAHLSRHARQLRQHVDTLAAKSYWRALPSTPESELPTMMPSPVPCCGHT